MRTPRQRTGQLKADTERCRTLYLGRLFDLSECLVEEPNRCPYALEFGDILVCWHPDRRKFERPPQAKPN
jgi:hypothetical protein